MRRIALGLVICAGLWTTRLIGQQPSDQSADEAAIRKAAASYAETFNKHDAKGLADHWSPDAVYLNRTTGEEAVGRDAIAEQFTDLFKEQPQVKLALTVASVQFVSPNARLISSCHRLLQADVLLVVGPGRRRLSVCVEHFS